MLQVGILVLLHKISNKFWKITSHFFIFRVLSEEFHQTGFIINLAQGLLLGICFEELLQRSC